VGGAANDSYSGGRMFKGDVSIVMHYNIALSSEEVLINYNAMRGRYGL
jgi:hypothetical protein